MQHPKISAVIPLYNAEKYIEKALNSLIAQTYPLDEIIVVDDCGSDESSLVVENYCEKHPKICLHRLSHNQGASAARNVGIAKASSEWILILDADDECGSTIVEEYVTLLKNNHYDAIYSNFLQIDKHGKSISSVFEGHELLGNYGFCQMLLRNPIISPSGSMLSKSTFNELKGFDTSMRYAEDVDFWLRLLDGGKNIGHIAKPLSFIRRHSQNTTANINTAKNGEKVLLKKYSTSYIKERIYSRNQLLEDNHLDYINLLIRYEKWEEVVVLINNLNIEKSYPRYNTYLFLKALVHLEMKQYDLAKQLYLEIIERNNKHGAALNNLAVIYAFDNEYEKANSLFEQAITLFPGYIDAMHNLQQLDDHKIDFKFTLRELRKNLLKYN
ncbi:hypothetical protein UACE39S_04438 [Ureibacillus acetophenoni]